MGTQRFMRRFDFCVMCDILHYVSHRKSNDSNTCYYDLGRERKLAFVYRVITTCFLKKYVHRDFTLSEMRKIKLLDIEQIILDLNVSTYISLIHPLNLCLPTLSTLLDYQRHAFVRLKKQNKTKNTLAPII